MHMGVPDRRQVVLGAAALAVLVVVVPLAVYAVPQVVGADHGYVVLSSSMSPAIGAGDVVIVRDVPAETIEAGDVITFRDGGERGGPGRVTHRVVEVVTEDGQRRFRTKGDANEDPDQGLVPPSAVIGRVVFAIPLLGHFVSFAGSDLGILLLVVVPSVALLVSEAWTLYRGLSGNESDATEDVAGATDGPEDHATAPNEPDADADD